MPFVAPPPEDVPEVFAEARRRLNHARRARALANVDLCKQLAASAYQEALDVEDHETMYHARACVGRLHRFRGEHEDAYAAFSAGLMEVRHHNIRRWLGPAHHDCFVEAMFMDQRDEAAPHAVMRMELWRDSPDGIFAFMQDVAYLRLLRNEDDARFLHQTAGQAMYFVGESPFDRMCLFASQIFAAGSLQHELWYALSLKRFEQAVGELGGSQEGVAMQMLDAARGAECMGDIDRAISYAANARHIATLRSEPVLRTRAEAMMLRLGIRKTDNVLIPATVETGIVLADVVG